MKTFFWFFVTLLSVAGFQSAFAAPVDARLSWKAPTAREDGTYLLPTEIAGYRVYQAVDGQVSDDPQALHTVVGANTVQTVRLDLVPRPEPYEVSFALRTEDTNGLLSDLSPPFTLTVVVKSTSPPAAATGVTVEINCANGCVITTVE